MNEHEEERTLPVEDLASAKVRPDTAEKVKGGVVVHPATPPGIPIPYPNATASKLPGE